MDKSLAKKYRPLVRAAIQTLELDEATDAILALLPGPERRPQEPAPPAPSPTPSKQTQQRRADPPLRRVASASTARESSPSHEPTDTKPQLAAEEYFTVQQASEYIGIGTERLYQILRDQPDRLPHRKEPGRGHDTYRLLGRGINQFRIERLKSSKVRMLRQPTAVVEEDEEDDDGDEGEGSRGATVAGPF